MKAIIAISFCIPLLFIISCQDNRSPALDVANKAKAEQMADSIIAKAESDAAKEIGKTATWSYMQDTDRMTSKIAEFAELRATDELDLGFPYEGSVPYIVLRYKRGAVDALFQVTKGQLHHAYDDPASISVRFDSAKAERYLCDEPSDGSSNAYFIRAKTKFIGKLKKAKKVWIETEFFESGLKVMEFNTAGLNWNH